MIRSAWDLEWEARMWRSSRDAELRAVAEFLKPMTAAARRIGIAYREAGKTMARAIAQLNRSLATLGTESAR